MQHVESAAFNHREHAVEIADGYVRVEIGSSRLLAVERPGPAGERIRTAGDQRHRLQRLSQTPPRSGDDSESGAGSAIGRNDDAQEPLCAHHRRKDIVRSYAKPAFFVTGHVGAFTEPLFRRRNHPPYEQPRVLRKSAVRYPERAPVPERFTAQRNERPLERNLQQQNVAPPLHTFRRHFAPGRQAQHRKRRRFLKKFPAALPLFHRNDTTAFIESQLRMVVGQGEVAAPTGQTNRRTENADP